MNITAVVKALLPTDSCFYETVLWYSLQEEKQQIAFLVQLELN